MDSNYDLGAVSLGFDFSSEDQNALDAPQPDLSCEPFYAGGQPLFYSQLVNYDW
jgi:hypothetical protein